MIQKKAANTDARTGKTSKKEDCGKVHENVTSVHSVALLSPHNTFKNMSFMYNVHNTLENSHILSTTK